MIRQFTLNLAANETREVALTGIYFQIFQMLQSLVLIEILDKSGGVISLLDSPLESMYIRATERYQTLRFSNGPTAQAVKFFYGDGDAGSNRFSGSITGQVSLDAATLAALEYVQVRPEGHTGASSAFGAMTANTPETIFTAAANLNGAILLGGGLSDLNAGGIDAAMTFLAKATAPTNVQDGAVYCRAAFRAGNGASTVYGFSGEVLKAELIPAGLGLFCIALAATSGASQRWARYRLL